MNYFQHRTPTPAANKKRKRRVKEFAESPVTPVAITRKPSVTVTPKVVNSSSCMATTPKRSDFPDVTGKKEEEENKSARSKIAGTSDSPNISSFLIGLDDLLSDNDDKPESNVACAGQSIIIVNLGFFKLNL